LWESSDFLSSWEAKLPSGASLSLDLLAGLFLPQDAGAKLNISYFPESKLSLLPQTRFKELFGAKPKWRLNEIKPFLKDLLGPGVTEEQLLLANSRISTGADGSKLYSAR
jgi:sister chromatid cohesion protein DCC1